MPFNDSYDLYADPTLPVGWVADSRFTHTLTGLATVDVAPGVPVGWNNQILAADAPIKGVARGDSSIMQSDPGVVTNVANKPYNILNIGPIWVNASKAVAAGVPAYAIFTGADQGKFTDTASASTTTKPVGRFERATTAAGKTVVFLTGQA